MCVSQKGWIRRRAMRPMLSSVSAKSPLLPVFRHETVIRLTRFQLAVILSRLFGMAGDTECHQIFGIVILRAPDMMGMQIIPIIAQSDLAYLARPPPFVPIPR